MGPSGKSIPQQSLVVVVMRRATHAGRQGRAAAAAVWVPSCVSCKGCWLQSVHATHICACWATASTARSCLAAPVSSSLVTATFSSSGFSLHNTTKNFTSVRSGRWCVLHCVLQCLTSPHWPRHTCSMLKAPSSGPVHDRTGQSAQAEPTHDRTVSKGPAHNKAAHSQRCPECCWVVLQVLADTLRLCHGLDACLCQLLLGADAREHQQLRVGDCAAAQQQLAASCQLGYRTHSSSRAGWRKGSQRWWRTAAPLVHGPKVACLSTLALPQHQTTVDVPCQPL